MIDNVAAKIANDFFTIAPKHRTKAQLAKHIEPLVYLVRQINWISGFAASKIPLDAAHKKLLEEIADKARKMVETVPEQEDVSFRKWAEKQ